MKIITWNVRVDLPLKLPRWNRRKVFFKKPLEQIHPDIFCIQEALKHQVNFFESILPSHKWIGVGRDDGKEKGEYCACFYNTEKFKLLESGTFWLSETPEKPSAGFDICPRICTWGKYRKIVGGNTFFVCNTHLPLSFNWSGKKKATHVLLNFIHKFMSGPVLLVGDFNSGPGSIPREQIHRAGFDEAGILKYTQHFYGVPLASIDAVYVNKFWNAESYTTIIANDGFVYASDHLGVVADVTL